MWSVRLITITSLAMAFLIPVRYAYSSDISVKPDPASALSSKGPLVVGADTIADQGQDLQRPTPDRNGDYIRNNAPTQAESPFNSPGSLWQVVTARLSCRSQPGMQYRAVRWFQRGEVLQANIGRGGSDEVLINAKDSQGKPWMFVRSRPGTSYDCYVRANRRYIQPYPGE